MASNKRKQDERHLKMLREMVGLPNNKQCFDCHQRGPTYINMTIGSYVCTSCSGILRGLNPPHRVKSISMASFNQEEMDFMKTHGNDFCRKVWLGLYDSRSMPEPDSREEQRVKDFMVQKYEKKRWYVAPTETMKEEARHQNELALSNLNTKSTRPIKSMLGEGATKLPLHTNQSNAVPPPGSALSSRPTHPPPVTAPVQSPAQPTPQAQPAPAQPKPSATMDLLGDLGGDPFAGSTAPTTAPPQQNTNPMAGGGFADFANFNTQLNSTPAFSTASTGPPLQPMGSSNASVPAPAGQPATAGFPAFSTATSQPATAPLSGSDRYAALADVFSSSPSGGSPQTAGGVPGQAVDWSGNSSMSWGAPSASSGTVNWDNPGTTASSTSWGSSASQSATTAGGAFANSSTTASNPFGARPGAMPQQSTQVGGSLFGGTAGAGAGGFGQFGQGAPGAPQSGGFAQFGMASQPPGGAPQGGFGGMQNGGFGMMPPASTAPGGFGFQQGASANVGGAQFGKPAPAVGGFGGAPQPFGGAGAGWGAPPPSTASNPFLSAATQPVPPRSNATNPFL
ncbi:arf-GAP domain and FG repeat-containing protein 1-like isoform X2 [Liolophura sinensis]|uniref:arf-GAP domain and FG repeat-containing protein 1-like isoform X2 n=1 Tax=Liolophura sinensis TaxID=3198878 RepID=UPI0031587263